MLVSNLLQTPSARLLTRPLGPDHHQQDVKHMVKKSHMQHVLLDHLQTRQTTAIDLRRLAPQPHTANQVHLLGHLHLSRCRHITVQVVHSHLLEAEATHIEAVEAIHPHLETILLATSRARPVEEDMGRPTVAGEEDLATSVLHVVTHQAQVPSVEAEAAILR